MVKIKPVNGKVFKMTKLMSNRVIVSLPKEWAGKWVVVTLDKEKNEKRI